MVANALSFFFERGGLAENDQNPWRLSPHRPVTQGCGASSSWSQPQEEKLPQCLGASEGGGAEASLVATDEFVKSNSSVIRNVSLFRSTFLAIPTRQLC